MLRTEQLSGEYNITILIDVETGLFLQWGRVIDTGNHDRNTPPSTRDDQLIIGQIYEALIDRVSLLSRLYSNATLYGKINPTGEISFEALVAGKGIDMDIETSHEYIRQVEGGLIYRFDPQPLTFTYTDELFLTIPKPRNFIEE